MRRLNYLLSFMIVLSFGQTFAQDWELVGPRFFSGERVEYTNIALAPDGTPYVLFTDQINPTTILGKASVMKWDGSNWVFVGSRSFTDLNVIQRADIEISPSGEPWIIANTNETNSGFFDTEVWKFDGTNWVDMTPTLDRGSAIEPKIVFDGATPYIAFTTPWDGSTRGMSCMKYNGTSWEYVGPTRIVDGFIYPGGLAIYNGNPYISFADQNNSFRGRVIAFDGTNWNDVGTPGFTTASGGGFTFWIDIEIASDGTPYVCYMDNAAPGGEGVNVMKFDGTNWVQVGPVNLTRAFWIDLELANDVPYIGYQDLVNGGASVQKYEGGSWSYVGSSAFTPTSAYTENLVFDGGNAYIVFTDAFPDRSISVMEFAASCEITDIMVSSTTCNAGVSYDICFEITGTNLPDPGDATPVLTIDGQVVAATYSMSGGSYYVCADDVNEIGGAIPASFSVETDCSIEFTFADPGCPTTRPDCDITDMYLLSTECNPDGSYDACFEIYGQNLPATGDPANGFKMFIDGDEVTPSSYGFDGSRYTVCVDNIQEIGNVEAFFAVQNGCTKTFNYDAPSCGGSGPCDVTDFQLRTNNPTPCNADGSHDLKLKVFGTGLPATMDPSAKVVIDGTEYAIASYSQNANGSVNIRVNNITINSSMPNVFVQIAPGCTWNINDMYTKPTNCRVAGDLSYGIDRFDRNTSEYTLDLKKLSKTTIIGSKKVVEEASGSISITNVVYPNPTSGKFTISGKGYEQAKYLVVNIMGQILKRGQIVNFNDETVDLSEAENGVYIVRILEGEEVASFRIVKK